LAFWIRIRIPDPDTDPDPQPWLQEERRLWQETRQEQQQDLQHKKETMARLQVSQTEFRRTSVVSQRLRVQSVLLIQIQKQNQSRDYIESVAAYCTYSQAVFFLIDYHHFYPMGNTLNTFLH
jgi:hypothetical protein